MDEALYRSEVREDEEGWGNYSVFLRESGRRRMDYVDGMRMGGGE
jgi:hypothetical protein